MIYRAPKSQNRIGAHV